MTRNEILIITNNPMVKNISDVKIAPVGNSNKNAVYYEVLNYLAQGHPLLSHPLAGSVKPNQNPYRSIIVGKEAGEFRQQDYQTMESCLLQVEKMSTEDYLIQQNEWTDDLQMMDQELLIMALNSLCESR